MFASWLRQPGTELERIAEALGQNGLHDVMALLDGKATGPTIAPDQGAAEGDKAVKPVN
jgi:hypothetical protein